MVIIVCTVQSVLSLYVNLHFQNSVNALFAVRRMSLLAISASKRRHSIDQSTLKTTSDQTVDRKVSAPLDPSTIHITERRREDTRNSCFDLNMATIQALQAKADKAMGKDLTHKEENKHENESDSEDEYSNESSDRDDNCTKNADENDIFTSKCNSTKQVFSNNQRQGKHDLRSESIF